MTTSLRFCLSYDCLKWDFIALKVDITSAENNAVTNSIMTLCTSNQVLRNVWSYGFYDKNDVDHWITATSYDKVV